MGGAGQLLPFFLAKQAILAAATALMILAAALVAAQLLFNADRGLLGAFISIGRHALRFEHGAGIQVQHAFGAKAETVAADSSVARIAAVKIFRRRFGDAVGDSLLQG